MRASGLISGYLAASMAAASAVLPAKSEQVSDDYERWQPAFSQTGSLTTIPIGHYNFCKTHQDDCSMRDGNTPPIRLTPEVWALLNKINLETNAASKPTSDLDNYGKEELWAYPNGKADCEDFALEKRRLLMQSFPFSTLLLTVVKKNNGEGHAVLTVRTDHGDFALDNLSSDILPVSETNYSYVRRQSEYDSAAWVAIGKITIEPLAVTASAKKTLVPLQPRLH